MRGTLALCLLVIALGGCRSVRPDPPPPPGCDALHFDLRTGRLNGLAPTASMEEVHRQLPCATGETAEGEFFNNGGGVFYINHEMYFYTHRDYIEVREGFAGTVEPALLGGTLAAVERVFGPPVRRAVPAGRRTFHATNYGCLDILTDGRRVTELAAHARACPDVIVD